VTEKEREVCSGSEAGSYLRLIDSFITQLKAQGPSRTCNESKEEEEGSTRVTENTLSHTHSLSHTLSLTHKHTLSHTLSRSLSLSHTHTHTHTLTHSHSQELKGVRLTRVTEKEREMTRDTCHAISAQGD